MSRVERATLGPAWRVELMTAHDLLEVVEIEQTCGLSLWGWDAYHAELTRPEAIMLVARPPTPDLSLDREVCGFIAGRVTAGELHVNNIGVRQTVRQRGLGGALLQAAFVVARQLGAASAVLEVRAGNLPAQALYQRYGFTLAGRRRNYYREPVEDALIMCAPLEPPT